MSEFSQPSAGPPALTKQQSKQPNMAMVVIVTALITGFVTSLCWVGIGAIFFMVNTVEPPPFTIRTEAPEMVELGDPLELVVTISNESDETATLGSIDMDDVFLEGFRIKSIDPKPNSQDSMFGIYNFYVREKMQPGDSVTYTFNLEAAKTGYWASTVDAATLLGNFTSHWIEVEVVSELPEDDEE